MQHGFARFVVRRVLAAAVTVLLLASAAFALTRLAPGDHLASFELDPATAAAERARLGLDRPFLPHYVSWLGRAIRLDFGESVKYRRPVAALLRERAGYTALLGVAALLVATAVGIPAGVFTGTTSGPGAMAVRAVSTLLLSVPPLIGSFALLLLAASTRWFPVGGAGSLAADGLTGVVRHLTLPCLAIALPLAAVLERLQSQAVGEAMEELPIRAAAARGCTVGRLVWKHAFRLALGRVAAIYGVLIGTVLSGSLVVEIVMSWPGLGALTHEALLSRDLYLVAGCAAAGGTFLAAGVLVADVLHGLADPRVVE